ncbi:unnamed protein product [Cyclocybe aegerita]|uniref:J domain-containing protein n=1 Tax=Cyclocybe aegerita TaxID=1973307 RepID=A0A8S0WWJ9_CYCAE|nr:unnamed protein product [Cyclocybe aegerita]
MGAFNLVTSLVGWTFIPDFATRHLLNFIYYQSPIRVVTPPPQGSIQHRRHYAITFAVVILGYLTYTLVQSARSMPPNFYEILGVPPTVDENGLKLAFRAFAKRFHPDRPGVGKGGEALFMYVRDAFEALKDPTVRFAYDRFGPEAVSWRQTCKTTREFLHQGLMVSSGYHIVAGIALLFWSAIGQPSVVSFWRYVLFAALLAGELSFILAPFPATSSNILPSRGYFFSTSPQNTLAKPSSPLSFSSFSILQTFFPSRVPYQHILFLHQVFMFLSVALSRVVPTFIRLLSNDGTDGRKLTPLERSIWERIYGTIAIADREASIILHTILQSVQSTSSKQPYHVPTLARMQPLEPAKATKTLEELSPEIQALVVEANIKNQNAGPIASAWEAVLRRSRSSSPGATDATSEAPKTPAPKVKNFWERDIKDEEAEDIITLVDAANGTPIQMSSPRAGDTSLPRTPSSSRLGPVVDRMSPTKTHSPVRRESFVGAGEF